jgi:hypothetical protein
MSMRFRFFPMLEFFYNYKSGQSRRELSDKLICRSRGVRVRIPNGRRNQRAKENQLQGNRWEVETLLSQRYNCTVMTAAENIYQFAFLSYCFSFRHIFALTISLNIRKAIQNNFFEFKSDFLALKL